MKRNLVLMGLLAGLVAGTAQAGITLNTVSAILIFPGVAALEVAGDRVETFLTITNTGTEAAIAHVAFINGDRYSSRYCYECDFDVPLSGRDTEALVLTRRDNATHIVNVDTGATRSCSQRIGFVIVDLEDSDHRVLTDNVLLGSEVVVDYASGSAWSVPAVPNGGGLGNGDRTFAFDNTEFGTYPSVVGADFLAPDLRDGLEAWLVLYTLAFERQYPPLTDCSIIGFDAFETQFSASIQFGCWTMVALRDIDPEFAYPYLGGAFDEQEHGWVQASCTVFGSGKNARVDGGVHGAIVQTASGGTVLRRQEQGPALANAVGWARLLYHSGTNGDPMILELEAPARGGSF